MTTLSGLVPLVEHDPELHRIIEKEKVRQWKGLELIASENFTSRAVMDALGSCLTNKYAEGYPGSRYYGGTEFVDDVEELTRQRALKAFDLDPEIWGVNVQPYSGSPANFEVYSALLRPHERIMGLDLPSGGHLTHGYSTKQKKISVTAVCYESVPYKVDKETGLINYDEMEALATSFSPRILICGYSAYPRDIDYARFRKVADKVGAILMCDMAHYSGLVAAKQLQSPFDHVDIVTSTTHKSLRGPRAGLIFFRKRKWAKPEEKTRLEEDINFAVFPRNQGGPHMNTIAGIATQMKEVCTPEYKEYAAQVKKNAATLAKVLMDNGMTLATGGTDNHIVLWDLNPQGLTGSKVEKMLEMASITVNKNTVPSDVSAMNPHGIRLGTPALTSRGFKEDNFEKVAEFLVRGIQITLRIQEKSGRKLTDFLKEMETNEEVMQLKKDVEEYATKFPMPGFDASELKLEQ